jgi:hypothetical protein
MGFSRILNKDASGCRWQKSRVKRELMSRHSRRASRTLSAVLLIFVSLGSLTLVNSVFAATLQVDVTVDPSSVMSTNKFSPGFMLDMDWKDWRDTLANRQLTQAAGFNIVRIFDWKSTSPDPCIYWYESTKTGKFDWTQIDLLIKRLRETGISPMVTLGGFTGYYSKARIPSGMAINSTTGLPNPESFAAYVVAWTKHFVSLGMPIKYFEIFNEAWYFFFKSWGVPNSVKLSNFVKLFNTVAKRVHEVDSKALLSTDSTTFRSVLDYFVKYAQGLGFLSFHKYDSGSTSDPDSTVLSLVETKAFVTGTSTYGPSQAVQVWYNARGVTLPVILTETNLSYIWAYGSDPRIQKTVGAVWTALMIRSSILSGLTSSLYYCFESSKYYESKKSTGGYGFGMVNRDDHKPWYPYYVQKMIGTNLSPGDDIVKTTSTSTSIRPLAWIHDDKLNILIISKVNTARNLQLLGVQGTATYFKIDSTVSWLYPRVQNGTADSSSLIPLNGYTVMLLQLDWQSSSVIEPMFQDGFASGNFDQWDGTVVTAGERASVSTSHPYLGSTSAVFTSDGNELVEGAYAYKNIDEGKVYARAYFQISKGLPLADDNDRFFLVRFTTGSQSVAGIGIECNNGESKWVSYARDGESVAWSNYRTTPSIEMNRWYSIELSWYLNSEAGFSRVYIDGQKVLELWGIDTTGYGNVDSVQFGLINAFRVESGITLYVDTAAISTSFITP